MSIRPLSFFLLLLISGCVSGVKYTDFIESDQKANAEQFTVFLYRKSTFISASGGDPGLWKDGERLGALAGGTFAVLHLDPGEHHIEARWHVLSKPYGAENTVLTVSGNAGEIAFYEYQILSRRSELNPLGPSPIAIFSKQDFVQVSSAQAEQDLTDLRILNWSQKMLNARESTPMADRGVSET